MFGIGASARGARRAAVEGADRLASNRDQVMREIDTGYNASLPFLTEQRNLFSGLRQQGQGSFDQYRSLTSGSGADVGAALQNTPGYQFALDQGMQGLLRARAAQGMLNSGNTDTDTLNYAQGLASQTLNQERQALLPLLNLYGQGMQGEAGALGGMAGLTTDYYGNRGSIIDDANKGTIGLITNAYRAGDQARAANSQMALGAFGSLANLAGQGLGGAGGISGLFSRLNSGRGD